MTNTNGTPTAAKTLEDVTLDQLVGLLEAIAIVKHERAAAALDVPRYQQLAGVNFFLDPDGALAIDERDGGRAHRTPLTRCTVCSSSCGCPAWPR